MNLFKTIDVAPDRYPDKKDIRNILKLSIIGENSEAIWLLYMPRKA